MQKTILSSLLALIAMTGWAQKFTISGDLSVMTNKFDLPPAKANIVYIWNDSLKGTPIEYAVKDGKFEISGNVSRPIYSKLMVQLEIEAEGRKDTTTEGIPFILEPGNIKMDSEWALLKGTPLNDASIAMCIKLSELAKAGEKEKLKQEAFNFVKQHAADPASIFVIVQAPNFMEAKDILTMIDMCSEEMQHTNIDFSLLREKVTLEAHAPQETSGGRQVCRLRRRIRGQDDPSQRLRRQGAVCARRFLGILVQTLSPGDSQPHRSLRQIQGSWSSGTRHRCLGQTRGHEEGYRRRTDSLSADY